MEQQTKRVEGEYNEETDTYKVACPDCGDKVVVTEFGTVGNKVPEEYFCPKCEKQLDIRVGLYTIA